jgi:quercetin dioxygenase-like cupin family protein
LEIEFQDGVTIFEQGDGVFIPDGEEHKHKARALTAVVRVVFVEDV